MRCLLSFPTVLARREISKDAELLVLRHETRSCAARSAGAAASRPAEHLAPRLGIRRQQRPDQPGVSSRGKNSPVQHLISRGRTARRRNAPSRLRAHRHPRPGPRLRRYALRPARRAPGSWAAQAQASAVSELRGFAKGLRKDWAAITELTTPYSSGAVEGHVNRIKMIQRQMYGRAKPDLLRKRVLLAD